MDVSNSGGDESSPTIAVDPTDNTKAVAVWTRSDPINLPAITPVIAQAAYSNDGGKTWAALALPTILSDPNLGPPSATNRYLQTTDSGVAFDRSHRFYISASEHDAKNLSGSIVLHKYDFAGTQPVLSAGNTVVHQWIGDEAFTPTLAVDAGVGNPVTSVPSGIPSGVAIGPDGNLYVGGLDINQVRKFDGTTGNLASIFASGAAVNQPTDLAFNPAGGDLYITNRQTGDVLRVDGTTGATKGVFNSALKSLKSPGDEVIGPDGFLYVSSRDTDSVLRYNPTTGAFLGTFVAPGSGGLSGPEGLVFGNDGRLYVSSGKTDEVDRYDAATGAYVDTFVAAKAGGLSHPYGLTFGADGSLYVASYNTGSVLRYAQANGAPLGVFATGSGLTNPTDLAFSPEDGNLYVESFGSSQLLRYSGSTGIFISDFLSSPTVALAGPIGLSFRAGHTLYVGSSGTSSVLVFNSQTGVFQSTVVPSGSGGLNTPAGLAFAADGSLLVASQKTNQVLKYSPSGNFTASVTPQPIKTPRDAVLGPDGATYYAVSRDTDSVVKYDANTGQLLGTFVASGSGGLNIPGGLAFGPDGNLYVGSEFNNTVIEYSGSTGAFIRVFVAPKSGGLVMPEGLTFGADGNLYVSSTLTDEVLRYNGTTGAFLSVYTPEPLKTPETAILSPDGKYLFVASRDGNDVVRYDGKTGSFLNIFVAPKSGGLLQPRGLAIGADGNLYVSSFSTDQVLKYDGSTGAPLGTFTPEPLKAPAGAVLGPDGNLYAASSGSDEVLKYDGTTGAFLVIFVSAQSGGLKTPEGVAFGADGNLYVASQGTDSILKFSGSTGALLGTFVAGGGALVQPEYLTFGPDGNLYVGSKATGEILKFSGSTGAFVSTFVAPGTGGLSGPEGLAFGPDGNLYVASRDTNQVLKFNGTSGATLGVFAAAAAGLTAPNGLAFGRDGNLYVSSKGDNRVLRFNGVTGALRDAFVPTGSNGLVAPTGLAFSANGDLVVAGSGNSQLLRYDASVARSISAFTPSGANAPNDARGVVVGPDGNIYVASFLDNKILKYDGSSGAYLSTFVTAGLGGLDGPTAIAFDAAGNLYVASKNTDQVLRYGPTGAALGAFVAAGANGLSSPTGLVFDAAGDLIVSSSGTNQVLRYTPAGAAFPSAGNTGATLVNAGASGPNGPEGLAIGPDTGLLTVASRFSNQVKFYNAGTGALVRSAGGSELAEPRGLAYGLDGDVYVTSGANNEVIRYNGQTGALVEVFAATGLGGLSTPVGVTFGRDRNLLVASSDTDQILTLSGANGASRGGFSPDPLAGPVGMRFGADGNLYVASRTGDKVLRYGPTGQFLGNFTPEPLKAPAGAVLGPDGSLYVASATRNEVLHYSAAGAYLGVFVPTGSGGLSTPSAIAFGPDGNLYVASTGTNSVLRYNGTTGTFFDVFVKPGTTGPTDPEGLLFSGGNLFVSSKGSNQILRYNGVTGAPNPITPGNAAIFIPATQGNMRGPVGLAVGPDGNLYVASSVTNEIYSYNIATGANVATFIGANVGGLTTPHDIAFSGGYLYVGSAGTNSVIRYLFATPATFNTYVAPGLGGLVNQSALLFDGSGNLLLSSTGTNQVIRYAPNTPAATSGVALTPDGLSAPEDLQFVGSTLLVGSFNTNEVLSYNATTGAQVGVFIAPGAGGLSGPQSLAFNGSSVYVTSSATNTVLQYDSTSGAFTRVFVAAGSGGLAAPQGLVFDPAISALLVSSRDTDEVIRYDAATGALFGTFTPSPLKHPVGIKFGPDGKLYAASSTTDRVLRYNTDGSFDQIFTSESLRGPEDAVLGPDGNLYVASQGTNEVLKYDGTTGAFLSTFVPRASGGLNSPSGVAFDRDGNLLVASKGTGQILKYDKTTGAFLSVFAAAGSGGLSAPEGIISGVFPDQNVYVASSGSNAVLKFNGVTGAFLSTFTTGTQPTNPEGLTFSADGKSLFVVGTGTNQVLQYDGLTGAFVKVFVAAGPTGPTAPRSVAIGPDGSLYVTSNGTDQVLRYSGATGQFLDAFVSKGRSGLSKPTGLTFRPDGTLLVASFGTDQVLRFDANGNALGAFTPGPLRTPERLAFDAAGNLYVSSFGTNSVLKYNSVGLLQSNFVPPGGGTLSGPEGLVFTADGSLLVASSAGDDILRYAGGTGLFKADLNPTRPSAPVDSTIGPDGLLYVSSRDANSVVRYDPATGKLLGTFVAAGSGTLKTPGGLVFGPDGNLYVSSLGTNQVLRFDGKSGVYVDVFADGSTGLSKPTGLAFGADGNLYVASFNSNQVLRYKGATGAFLSAFVTAGSGGLSGPSSLAFGPDGNLYVASQNTNAVNRYRLGNGSFLSAFVAPNSGGLDGPTNIAFDAAGNLLVASNSPVDQDNRVLKYGPGGAPLGTLVARGSGGLLAPSGLAVAADGSLYVSSRDTGRILKYVAGSGAFVSALDINPDTTGLAFGVDGNGDGVQDLLVAGYTTDSVTRYDGRTGEYVDTFIAPRSGGLRAPTAVRVGPGGLVYVSSSGTNQVLKYDGTTGAFVGVAASGGGLSSPDGIAFGADGTLYVSSRSSDQVLAYNPQTGAFLRVAASGNTLAGPRGLAVDAAGNLEVASAGGGNVLKFRPTDGSFLGVATRAAAAGFTDPDTGVAQNDPFSGNVYLAWATNQAVGLSDGKANLNPSAIELVASSDGGKSFSAPTVVNDSKYRSPIELDAQPRITISQGTADGKVAAGQVTVAWDDFGSGNFLNPLNPPRDFLHADRVSPGVTASYTQAFAKTDNKGTIKSVPAAVAVGPSVTNFKLPVNISDPRFTTVSHVDVHLNLTDADLTTLEVDLIGPDGTRVPLIRNPALHPGAPGVVGANLGGIESSQLDTIFDQQAARTITDGVVAAPYIGRFQPDSQLAVPGANPPIPAGPTLDAFKGLGLAGANGFWTLEITDFSNKGTPFPAQRLVRWGLDISSGVTAGVDSNIGTSYVTGRLTGTKIVGVAASGPYDTGSKGTPLTFAGATIQGIAPGVVLASDNTLGSFSPVQGRIYASYTQIDPNNRYPFGLYSDDTNVVLVHSDDAGLTWSGETQVNDDNSQTDGFSEAYSDGKPGGLRVGRPQFSPSIAVDQSTGTLALSFYDARNDPSRARVATYVALSSDGGATFAPETFANTPNTAADGITRQTVTLGPIPDNQSPIVLGNPYLGNASSDILFGYGDHQGLAFVGGRLYPAWSGNENGGPLGTNLLDIRVAALTTSAGPRVLTSTEGTVKAGTAHDLGGNPLSFNNTVDANGSPFADGFLVTFDRAVDPGTVGPTNVRVTYRDVNTSGFAAGANVPVLSVTPLLEGNTPQGPTKFLVRFTRSSATGTYSYAVGPNVRDRVRTVSAGAVVRGNLMDQNGDGVGGEDPSASPFTGNAPGDIYAVPTPKPATTATFAGATYTPPYDRATQPLIVPGPHPVSSFVPGQPRTVDNLVTDAVVSTLAVVFDRDIDASTFDASKVLRIVGPNGQINGPFNVALDPAADAVHPRIFDVTFPPQQLSGGYTVTLASTIAALGSLDRLDTNQNAGLDVLRGDPSAGTTVSSYSSSDQIPPAIGGATANVVTTSRIVVPDNFVVQGLTITLNLTYPNDPDLTAALVAPDGTTVQLFTAVGAAGSAQNFTNTTLDDTATTPIQNGGAPFFGSYNPQFPLSAFKGHNSGGTWTLRITDKVANRTGTINAWSLALKKPISLTGLGEPVADRATVGFRIFTLDPSNPLASNAFTPVGPTGIGAKGAALNAEISGRVTGLTVDPSDPSGNTVYVGAASGGVWKTTNFLTTSPAGPTYVPLTDAGPTFSLNIGGIAAFGRNNDPNQTILFAGTGEGDTLGYDPQVTPSIGNSPSLTTRGVGFLKSTDGGSTWLLLDSTVNTAADGTPLPISSPLRDHVFVGTTTFKVVVDPRPTPTGDQIIYAALSDVDPSGLPVNGAGRAGGLWRSVDSGRTWQKLRAGQATDVVLDENSGTGAPGGNLQSLYAAFRGEGVFSSPNRGQTLALMTGTTGDPLIQNADGTPAQPVGVLGSKSEFVAGTATPNGNKGRIVLARPALTGNPLDDLLYQGWLYAAVVSSQSVVTADNQLVLGGHLEGLYLTKDFGQNWTRIQISDNAQGDHLEPQIPTNDSRFAGFDPLGEETPYGEAPDIVDPANLNLDNAGQGNYDISLAVDPNNANVVYLGGNNQFHYSGLIRVDATALADAHSFVVTNQDPEGRLPGNNSTVDAKGGQLRPYPNDPNPANPQHDGITLSYGPGPPVAGLYSPLYNPTLNLVGDPAKPFVVGSTVLTTDTSFFPNTGAGARWIPFDQAIKPEPFSVNPADPWSLATRGVHRIVALKDPATGKTRLIFGDDSGVFTAVDSGNGQLLASVGNVTSIGDPSGDVTVVSGSRNGNLQDTQILHTAAEPSNLAAQMSTLQGFFYDATRGAGSPNSVANIINVGQVGYGNITYGRPNTYRGTEVGVATVQTGPGQPDFGAAYRSLWPSEVDNGQPTDFFQVDGVSRTSGLLQNTNGQIDPLTGPVFDVPDGQWPFRQGFNFSVNPINGDQILISSAKGRVFRTENQGKFWSAIGEPTALDGTNAQALAFGAPDPNGPGGVGNQDSYLLAGTIGGNVFVTFTGGGTTGSSWVNISAGLDGSALQQVVTNPTPGTHEAYAVTQRGVYHIADTRAAGATWTSITGNLFAISKPLFGNANQVDTRLRNLTSLVADWRYIIPDNAAAPTGPSHPILYAGGEGGVFRSLDDGTTWSLFPNADPATTGNTLGDGGGLPNALVTDLQITLGQINPTTGRPDVGTGPNILTAATYGRGAFTIRLAPITFASSVQLDPNLPAPGGSDNGISPTDKITSVIQPVFDGLSEQSAFGSVVTVNLIDQTDPLNPVVIGTGQTDAAGRFVVQVVAGHFKADGSTDGVKQIGVQAIDQSGTKGTVVNFTFTLDTSTPASTPAPDLQAASDSGVSSTDNITAITAPTFDISPAEATSTVQLLRKLAAAPVGSYTVVGTRTGPGAVQDAGPVADGVYTYASRQVDQAGNVGAISGALTVTIDTAAPVAPVAPDLEAGSDTGASNTDNITSATSPTFDLAATEAGATLTLLRKLASAPTSSYVVVGQVVGTGAVNDAGPVADGVYTYAARQTDVAGNLGPIGPTLTVTVDTAPPAASSIPDLTPASDSGASNTDNVTNVAAPTFNVASAESTATVRLLRDNVVVATRVGPGALVDPGPIADGVHQYASQQVDNAGNVGAISSSLAVTFDTQPPVAAGPPDLQAGSDSGLSSTDNITDVTSPLFDIAPGEAGATVQLLRKVDGSAASTYVVVGTRTGPGAVQDAGPVPDGLWDYASRQVDLAGNVGPISGILVVQELTVAPAAPIAPDLEAGSDTGSSSTDNYTSATSPIFDVVATAPGVTVQLLRKLSSGGAFAVVGSIAGGGAVADPGPVADGVYLYAAQQVDAAGNVGPIGASLAVTIDTTAPLAAGTPDLQSASDSGPSNTDNITNVVSPVFDVAPAEATATVQLLRAGIVVATRVGPGALQDPGPLAQGTYLYTSRQVDLAGIFGPVSPVALSVTILTGVGVPGVPDLEAGSDSGASNTDNITDVTSPIFDVAPAAANAVVSLLRNGVVVGTRTGPGAIQDPGPLADGVYQYTARQTDAAGNVSGTSAALAVTITTTGPRSPGTPDLQAASDSGISNTDNITNATAPVFDVAPAVAGQVVQLLRNGVVVATRSGPGAIADPGPVADGTYLYTSRQVDQAGNLSPPSGPLSVTIDTSPPAAAGAPDLQAASDTGTSSTDNVTSIAAPTFDVAPAEAAATVSLYRDGVLVASRVGSGPITDAGPVPDGVHQYTSRQVDPAGNVGPPSAALAITVDTAAPGFAGTPDLQAASDSGISNTDNITNVNTPTFDVAPAEATATVQLLRRVDGTTTYTVVASRVGPGALRDPGPVPDGIWDYASRQVDLAGNPGPAPTAYLAITIQTVTPPATGAPDLEAGSDSGPSNTDNITNVTTPIFDVSGVLPTSTLQLYRNSVLVATLTNTAGGTIAIQDPGPLPNGVYLYAARQVDQAGNAGPLSGSLQVTIVAGGPTFVPGTPDLQSSSDSGPSSTDNYTNVANPAFDVAPVEPGVGFQLLRDNVVVGTAVGSGSVRDAGPVPDGVHVYTAREVDSAGNVGPSSPGLSVTIDTVVSPPGAPDLQAASDTGASSTDNITRVTSPTFDILPAEAGAVVRLLRNGVVVGTRTGPGAIQDPGPLADGTYVYTATQTDLAGNVGTAGAALSVTIDTARPVAASAPDLQAASDSGSSSTDNVTSAKSPVFDVTSAEANATVQLLRNGVAVASRVGPGPIADAGPVPDGFYSYTAVQADLAGNVGPASPSLGVTIDSTAPAAASAPDLEPGSDSGISNTDNLTNATTPLLDILAAEPAATVQLYANGVLVGTRVGPGAIAVAPALVDGVYAFNARQTDAAGNVGPLGASLSVTIDTRPPGIPTLSLDPNSDTGVKGDGITSVRLPRFLGNADLGVTVLLVDDIGRTLGATTASAADGTFAVVPINPLPDGVYTLQSVAVDAAGNRGAGSTSLRLTISGSLPAVPTIGLLPADDTGIPGDGITNVNRPRIVGLTDGGLRVDLLNAAGAVVGTGVSTLDGKYSIQPTSPFADGAQTLKVRVTDLAGGQSTSAALSITVDTVAPPAPAFALLPADDTGVAGDNVTANRRARLFGTSERLSTVQLLLADGTVIAQNTTPLVDGNFVLQPTLALPVGKYAVYSRATDAAGNVGAIGAPLTLTILHVAGDYDGDGKADLVSYNRNNSQWTITESSGPVVTLFFGQPGTDVPVAGDFDGDGKTDVAVYRPGTGQWFILRSTAGPISYNFGQPQVDIPVPGDFDGDGKDDIAAFRPSTGQWLINQSSAGPKVVSFGAPVTDKPVVADFDGDGKIDLALYRPSTSQWLILQSTAGPKAVAFGGPTDVPVPADFDGDGKADLAVYRPTTAQWLVLGSTSGPKGTTFGQANVDIPTPQDLDGDGKADLALFRPNTAQWISLNSTTGPSIRVSGNAGDIPVPSPYDYRKVGRAIINSVGGATPALDFGGLAAGLAAPSATKGVAPKVHVAGPKVAHHANRRPAQVRAARRPVDGV